MNPNYEWVAERARYRCEYCLASQATSNFELELEHVVPLADEGTGDPNNLALACRSCNVFKGSARVGLDSESGQLIRLFHPRNDAWDEHFELSVESAEIRGRTAIGRATVHRLRMNSPRQLTARAIWRDARLHPG